MMHMMPPQIFAENNVIQNSVIEKVKEYFTDELLKDICRITKPEWQN